ncbi:DUF4124 domain-containing protein [Pseudomonas sp. HR96]|uniref:DUF4124 domain-containing protein n=1 Tax=Pseudomonas sp. HR96 TaxID=1027966 RepID=UPI002A755EBB|nr:DUF4124 domain-containing protein [Pseudomonas sp. HR96]WPO99654.1 DUF4124 domain-containing protein [Pseudomonas sp. HR96]
MRPLFLLIALLFAVPASAQIYKYTDANGHTAFSSQPPNDTKAEPIDLQPLPNVQTPAADDAAAPAPGGTPAKPAAGADRNSPRTGPSTPVAPGGKALPYQRLALTDLPTADALRANNGNITVGVDIAPALSGTRLVRLVLDGEVYGEPTNQTKGLKLENLDRGDHSMAVQVVDGDQVIQQSGDVEFTIQRAHQ